MKNKLISLIVGASLLLTPCTVLAKGGSCDYDTAHELYVASAQRAEVTAETRPEYPVANAAMDNDNLRDNSYTRFVETDEKHFLTITSVEDGWAVFGHEESFGVCPDRVYDVEVFIRNDASLCMDGHLPSECDKTLQDVKVRVAFPDSLSNGHSSCLLVEISSSNGNPVSISDYVELTGVSGEERNLTDAKDVRLALVPGSIVVETDGLTDGMQLDANELFGDDGASVGYYSLDSGIPAGYSLRVKFQIQT